MLLLNEFVHQKASLNLVRGAASSLVNSTSPQSSLASQGHHANGCADSPSGLDSTKSSQSPNTPTSLTSSSTSSQTTSQTSLLNREIRIGCTYAYVELANLLGSQWLEKNLRLFLTHILNLVNNTKSVSRLISFLMIVSDHKHSIKDHTHELNELNKNTFSK
jgi:hypothetical protein